MHSLLEFCSENRVPENLRAPRQPPATRMTRGNLPGYRDTSCRTSAPKSPQRRIFSSPSALPRFSQVPLVNQGGTAIARNCTGTICRTLARFPQRETSNSAPARAAESAPFGLPQKGVFRLSRLCSSSRGSVGWNPVPHAREPKPQPLPGVGPPFYRPGQKPEKWAKFEKKFHPKRVKSRLGGSPGRSLQTWRLQAPFWKKGQFWICHLLPICRHPANPQAPECQRPNQRDESDLGGRGPGTNFGKRVQIFRLPDIRSEFDRPYLGTPEAQTSGFGAHRLASPSPFERLPRRPASDYDFFRPIRPCRGAAT